MVDVNPWIGRMNELKKSWPQERLHPEHPPPPTGPHREAIIIEKLSYITDGIKAIRACGFTRIIEEALHHSQPVFHEQRENMKTRPELVLKTLITETCRRVGAF